MGHVGCVEFTNCLRDIYNVLHKEGEWQEPRMQCGAEADCKLKYSGSQTGKA